MTVFKDTRELGINAAYMALDIIGGYMPSTFSTINNGAIDVPEMTLNPILVQRGNIQSVLIDSGYYSASEFTGL